MEQLMADAAAFIERHSMWAGPVLGLITFGESMVLIGAFFPATALMVVAGGLAAAGVIDPIPVLLWCIAGATLGDAISYWIGRAMGPKAFRHRLLKPHRRALARARLFFRKYGTLSILLCRFMGPVRAFVPLIAGMTTMNQRRFQLANAGSAAVWVPIMLAPGYLAGKGVSLGFGDDPHALGLVVLVAIGGMVVATVAWHVIKAKLDREGA